jgi:putative PEP-CTERM system TPR-repeat lipoprotein
LRRWDEARSNLQQVLKRDPGNTEALRGLASIYLNEGNLAQARGYLDAAVRNAPDDPEVWVTVGRLYQSSGDSQEAETAYRRALQSIAAGQPEADSFAARVGLAWALLGQGELDQAQQQAQAVERIAPGSPAANHLLGTIALRKGDYNDAEIILQKALEQTSDDPRIELTLALAHFAQGHYEQAETLLRKFLKARPDFSAGHRILLDIQFRKGDVGRALEHLQGIENESRQDQALFQLMARAAILSGRVAEAEKYLKRALQVARGETSEALRLAIKYLGTGERRHALKALDAAQPEATPPPPPKDALVPTAAAVQGLMARGQLDQALARARAFAASYPELAVPQNLLGAVYLRQGNLTAARTSFEQAIALEPTNTTGAMNLARLELNLGNLRAARTDFERVLRLQPKSVAALQGMAEAALMEGGASQATEWLERARSADPSAIAPRVNLARLYLREGQLPRAREVVSEAEVLSPTQAGVAQLVSDIYRVQEKPGMAVQHFRGLSKRYPDAPALHYQLARAYRLQGQDQEAEQAFKRAVALDPSHVGAVTGVIQYAAADNRLPEALALAEGLVQRQPEGWEGHTLVGDVQMRRGDASAAEKAYRAAMQRKPSAALANKLTKALSASGAGTQALAPLTGWLDKHPDDSAARHYLAAAYLREGADEQALAEYRHIEQANPDDLVALNNMASILARTGKAEEAVGFARRANELRQGIPAILDTLGWSLVQAGKSGDGLGYLQSAVDAAPDEAQIRFHLAVAQLRSDQQAAAVENLSQALASPASFQSRQEAEALLKSLPANTEEAGDE